MSLLEIIDLLTGALFGAGVGFWYCMRSVKSWLKDEGYEMRIIEGKVYKLFKTRPRTEE